MKPIRSEVSFRFDMHNCFKAVVKQKWKKFRWHTLVAREVGPLRGTVRQCAWGLFCLLVSVGFDSEDLKRVRALSPLEQERTAWIRTMQSLGFIAHRSNHWANATNLTYKLMKQSGFYSWKAKSKIAFQKLVEWVHFQLTLLALSKVMTVWLQTRMEVVCTVLIYHSVKKSFEHMFWCSNTSSDSSVGAYSP
jgi:hypothetical protein